MFDLPMMARNEFMGRLIGDSLGQTVEVDMVDGEVVWNEAMRIRMKLNVTKPLVRRKRKKIGDGEAVWVRLAYERLPEFCYYYGIIGHCHRDCEWWLSITEQIDEERLPYGHWLVLNLTRQKN